MNTNPHYSAEQQRWFQLFGEQRRYGIIRENQSETGIYGRKKPGWGTRSNPAKKLANKRRFQSKGLNIEPRAKTIIPSVGTLLRQ
ncbi:hypothetical protein Z042_12625 [Chania multitudinisentens RB-25]|uniref:Uncharacterized protein n=1 Tax=Chania multitudinisentens RB-25 TaxID=1441930 RepID=W0LK24_9GAMM|nr:hypothetical protein Z042_12625 [Chania multitudinisentens RB-25]